MPLDGLMLRHLVNELKDDLKDSRINRFTVVNDTSFLLYLRSNKNNLKLIVSLSPSSKRICLTTNNYESLEITNPFFRFLKKQLDGAIIKNISQYKCDRVVLINLVCFNDFKDKEERILIIEFTRSANIIFLDNNYKIIDALYKTTLDSNRLIVKGCIYTFLENNKLDPFVNPIFSNNFNKEYDGISLALFNYLSLNQDKLNNIITEVKPSIFTSSNNKLDFYSYPLGLNPKSYKTLSLMLEDFYYDNDRILQIKKETNNLDKYIKRMVLRLDKKLRNLEEDLNNTSSYSKFKELGDILYTYKNLKEHLSSVTLFNFYTNKDIEILLDPRISVLNNANKFYQKAAKLKKSIPYLNEQIDLTKKELVYYNDLLQQLSYLTVLDINDLKLELKLDNKTYKKTKPHIITYHLPSGAKVYVGRNNIQNNYLTHKFAKNTDMWFHVLNASGSHVLLRGSLLTEEDIRYTAMLAAYYSSLKHSSSIPVTYTLKKYVKKMSGYKGSFVKYSNEKTIYIDILHDKLNELKKV